MNAQPTSTSAKHDVTHLPGHFHSFDVLRGTAAFTVVFWHWQHFFGYGTEPFDAQSQPLFWLLKPFYTKGYIAVSLFFSLSGFIFYWLYAERISRRDISPREFFVLRFSRLYPLHIATLIIVAALQLLLHVRYGRFFVYFDNDFYHFILQLVLASEWGLLRGHSFNGPIWSVSVEVLLYFVFYWTCIFNLRRWWHLILLACFGLYLNQAGFKTIGDGFLYFFVGGLTYQAFGVVSSRSVTFTAVACLVTSTTAMWLMSLIAAIGDRIKLACQVHTRGITSLLFSNDAAEMAAEIASHFSFQLILFPTTLMTLAMCESYRGSLGRRLKIIGDLSYSIYLLHFPLQLVFIAATLALHVSPTFYYTPRSLYLFMSILIPISCFSYYRFEKPCQLLIRNRFSGSGTALK